MQTPSIWKNKRLGAIPQPKGPPGDAAGMLRIEYPVCEYKVVGERGRSKGMSCCARSKVIIH